MWIKLQDSNTNRIKETYPFGGINFSRRQPDLGNGTTGGIPVMKKCDVINALDDERV